MGKQIEIKMCGNCEKTFEGVNYLCDDCGNYNSENNFKKWTKQDVQFLIDNYQELTRTELAKELGRSFSSIKSKAKTINLKKTAAAISKIGKRPNKGQYSKGQTPINYNPVGTVLKQLDKRTGNSYLYIKIKDDKDVHSVHNYKALHQFNWEKENGPIPKGMILSFKDGDSFNCDISNLELITMGENMIRNSASLNLTDGAVAFYLSPRDEALRKELLKHPELINIKRESINLNRKINEQTKK